LFGKKKLKYQSRFIALIDSPIIGGQSPVKLIITWFTIRNAPDIFYSVGISFRIKLYDAASITKIINNLTIEVISRENIINILTKIKNFIQYFDDIKNIYQHVDIQGLIVKAISISTCDVGSDFDYVKIQQISPELQMERPS
jgi:hypothetical protein